jgi:hypothetical protein
MRGVVISQLQDFACQRQGLPGKGMTEIRLTVVTTAEFSGSTGLPEYPAEELARSIRRSLARLVRIGKETQVSACPLVKSHENQQFLWVLI